METTVAEQTLNTLPIQLITLKKKLASKSTAYYKHHSGRNNRMQRQALTEIELLIKTIEILERK